MMMAELSWLAFAVILVASAGAFGLGLQWPSWHRRRWIAAVRRRRNMTEFEVAYMRMNLRLKRASRTLSRALAALAPTALQMRDAIGGLAEVLAELISPSGPTPPAKKRVGE